MRLPVSRASIPVEAGDRAGAPDLRWRRPRVACPTNVRASRSAPDRARPSSRREAPSLCGSRSHALPLLATVGHVDSRWTGRPRRELRSGLGGTSSGVAYGRRDVAQLTGRLAALPRKRAAGRSSTGNLRLRATCAGRARATRARPPSQPSRSTAARTARSRPLQRSPELHPRSCARAPALAARSAPVSATHGCTLLAARPRASGAADGAMQDPRQQAQVLADLGPRRD